ncbi:MAG: hypothetical protein QM809_01430 [Gordonia sp. (in: high G+C Gram-positive bacteria)]|uniref:hypothetical protein n=1 Tax=Gordonia sp. (in: high G+C Gram-positive bacteria) TaxID=84139 RepID=UPI0039E25646
MNALADSGVPVDDDPAASHRPPRHPAASSASARDHDPAYRASDVVGAAMLWLLQCALGVAGVFVVGFFVYAGAHCGVIRTGDPQACDTQALVVATAQVALAGSVLLAVGVAVGIVVRVARGGLASRVALLGVLLQFALSALCVLVALVIGW